MRVERNNIDRKVFSLKDFRGVDYASSPLEVKPYRATDMANLLLRDGQLQKRYGFRQKEKLAFGSPSSEYRFFQPPNHEYFVIQETAPGVNRFYTYHRDEDGTLEPLGWQSITIGGGTAAMSINIGGKMYLFIGREHIYYFDDTVEGYGADRIFPVSDYYIPTTTINIPVNASILDEEGFYRATSDTSIKFPYESHESVNMLTKRVRNKLLCNDAFFNNTSIDKNINPWFSLDGRASYSTTPILKLGIDEEPYGTFEKSTYGEVLGTSSTATCWYNKEAGVMLHNIRGGPDYLSQWNMPTKGAIIMAGEEGLIKFRAMLGGIQSKDGTDNKEFIIEYTNDNLKDESKKITTCNVASIFGVDGANDRLFIGNSRSGGANIVYFSENDESFKPNPTYFPVNNFIVCGSSEAPISGFLRNTDGRLAVFKDVTNTEDVAVYYINGYYVEHTDSEIGTTYQEARFTVKAGDINRRGISARSVVNLEGDNIFTSAEGVYGIQLSNNVASGERYARERSRTINPKITKLGLKNAKGIVYDDKYFLAVDNGEVYVADARYKFTLQGDQQNTFNYEWFRLTGLWVKEWFILDDKLYFIDKDGWICEFTEGFTDQYYMSTSRGELSVHVYDDGETKSGMISFKQDRLSLVKASSYAIERNGRKWQLELVDTTIDGESVKVIKIPDNLINEEDIKDAMNLHLWFCVPIAAYWQSAVMDLNSPMYLKNMWSLSMVVSAKHGGKINLGYKTRMNAVNNIEVEGANDFAWGEDIDIFGGTQTSMLTGKSETFGMYTFDVGGYVGINTYRRRLFERNFAHIQLLFTSETATDCSVSEMDIEYSIARKNIGVG